MSQQITEVFKKDFVMELLHIYVVLPKLLIKKVSHANDKYMYRWRFCSLYFSSG